MPFRSQYGFAPGLRLQFKSQSISITVSKCLTLFPDGFLGWNYPLNYKGGEKMKVSARNLIKGTISDVDKGMVAANIKIKIETPTTMTAVITKESANKLDLKPGDPVHAMIKATSVMIAKEE